MTPLDTEISLDHLVDAFKKQFLELCSNYVDGDFQKIMPLAKAICKAEGHDPDQIVIRGTLYHCAKGTVAFPNMHAMAPQWWSYCSEARAALAFMENQA